MYVYDIPEIKSHARIIYENKHIYIVFHVNIFLKRSKCFKNRIYISYIVSRN